MEPFRPVGGAAVTTGTLSSTLGAGPHAGDLEVLHRDQSALSRYPMALVPVVYPLAVLQSREMQEGMGPTVGSGHATVGPSLELCHSIVI